MKSVKLTIGALALLLSATGCTTPVTDLPSMIVLPDGSRGYSMWGYVTWTHDEAVGRDEAQKRASAACGGPAKIIDLKLRHNDSLVGAPHLRYDMVYTCPS